MIQFLTHAKTPTFSSSQNLKLDSYPVAVCCLHCFCYIALSFSNLLLTLSNSDKNVVEKTSLCSSYNMGFSM